MAMAEAEAEAEAEAKVSPVRFGILGCAKIARKVSRAIGLAPNAVITAVGSRSAEKAARFISANGLPGPVQAYGSYEAVLEDTCVDAVYVPLPTSLHLRWATAAAERGKHVLLEKPVALHVSELDRIVEACERNGVQLMDATMWMHHPRTAAMRSLVSDPNLFGHLRTIHSHFSYCGNSDFYQNNIRVKPDLDALGGLGDTGWYCIRAILWVANYELPKRAIALHGTIKNEAGVILHCGASFLWEDGKVATFTCSLLTHLTMELCAIGTKGTLNLSDFVIPFQGASAEFTFGSDSWFKDPLAGWDPVPCKHVVDTHLPQEACMVKEFSRLVQNIKTSGAKPENHWPSITRKTQLVLDAVKASIDKGCEPVDIVN